MANKLFDVLIVGAGPGGCATALSLKNSGLNIALIDKASFPREKICGDGITMDTLNQMKKLSPRLYNNIINLKQAVNCKGYLISAPNGRKRFFKKPETYKNYIVEREYFDNELVKECKLYDNISVYENTRIESYELTENKVEIKTSNENFTGKIIVGADGANSMIAKTINPNRTKETNFGIGVRAYFDNVKDDGHNNLIEIHYLKDFLPGYFWIFHLSNVSPRPTTHHPK